MRATFDPQELLARDDKWYIAGGRELAYAPSLPAWTDVPGFWPYAWWFEWQAGPLFTVTVLDEQAKELPAKLVRRRWTPSHVVHEYALPKKLRLVERRAMTANDALVSELTLHNNGAKTVKLNVVAWTCIATEEDAPGKDFLVNIERDGGSFVWTRDVKDAQGALSTRYAVTFGTAPAPATTCLCLSGRAYDNPPWWHWTPFFWKMRPEGLPDEFVAEAGPERRGTNAFLFAAEHVALRVPARGKKTIVSAASVAATKQRAIEQRCEALAMRRPIESAIKRCKEFFESVPQFRCSDPYIERYYWYRWWGIYACRVRPHDEHFPYPCVFEGVSSFRALVSYSAQCHMLECRWMHDPALAQGSLLNFIHDQRDDGSFLSHIYNKLTPHTGRFIYHCNWGWGVRKLLEIHPSKEFLAQVYEPLAAYARYFDRQRDREHSGLYDVINQAETGQEYMGRYLFTDPLGDQFVEGRRLEWKELEPRLKGVDATTYIYELKKQLGWLAQKLGKRDEASTWAAEAETIKRAMLEKMWDPERAMFCDVNPETGERSPHDTAVSFYPFMTDVPGPDHVEAIRRHLLNPDEFWLPYPIPSTSAKSPYFSPDSEWKRWRMHCTWSGPTWLMTNSHAAEALGNAALTLDERVRPWAVEFLKKFIRMLFLDGRLDRPTSYEYYHPFTGRPPFFRGVDDYMHSWIVELILKYIAGVQTLDGDRLVVEPLDFALKNFTVEKLYVRGRTVRITWRARKTDAAPKGLTVSVNGRRRAHADALTRLEVDLSAASVKAG